MARIALTQRLVTEIQCPAGKQKIDLFDTKQTGFFLEVRTSGGKTFYQRYTDERSRTKQFKIGSAEFLNLVEARRLGRQAVSRALLGDDPQKRKLLVRSIPTLRQFSEDRYLSHVKAYKRSWSTDETVLRVHILPEFGHVQLDQLGQDEISLLLEKLRAKGYTPSGTVNRTLIVLRHLFNLALKWKVPGVTANPTDGLILAADVCRQRFLTEEEAARLLRSIDCDENVVAAKSIKLLMLTGARRNEITQAKWEHVDFSRRILRVPISKSGKPHNIVLNEDAMQILRSVPRDEASPYIFRSPLTNRPCSSLHFPWERIRRRAGLHDLRLHDLRHSFASFLVNRGKSLYVVQKLLGHENARYTQRYAHLTSETLSDAVEVVSRALNGR